jgi:hypothetical protein
MTQDSFIIVEFKEKSVLMTGHQFLNLLRRHRPIDYDYGSLHLYRWESLQR